MSNTCRYCSHYHKTTARMTYLKDERQSNSKVHVRFCRNITNWVEPGRTACIEFKITRYFFCDTNNNWRPMGICLSAGCWCSQSDEVMECFRSSVGRKTPTIPAARVGRPIRMERPVRRV